MKKKIVSVAINSELTGRYGRNTILPLLNTIEPFLYRYYGKSFPRGYQITDEPVNKLALTRLHTLVYRLILQPIVRLFKISAYKSYRWQETIFDLLVASRLRRDCCDVLYTRALMYHSIIAAKKRGKKIVIRAADSEPYRQARRYQAESVLYNINNIETYGDKKFIRKYSKGLEYADAIITISDASYKTYIDAGYPPEKLVFIPLSGITLKSNEQKGSTKAFITTAHHSLLKGTHRLLLAWNRARIKDIPLIIVGPLKEDMKEFISKFGPFNNVQFVGMVEDLAGLYANYDAVGVLMSFSEGAGRTVQEMASVGFPMIVSPDATCNIVQDGINGYVVDPINEELLVDRLKECAENWDKVHLLGRKIKEESNRLAKINHGEEIGKYLIQFLNEEENKDEEKIYK